MAPTSDQLRRWRRWGEVGSTEQQKPMRFLERQGYTLSKGWGWHKPSPSHVVTTEEADAIQYLMDEWDYAGLEE
jgi:hypothetical protein